MPYFSGMTSRTPVISMVPASCCSKFFGGFFLSSEGDAKGALSPCLGWFVVLELLDFEVVFAFFAGAAALVLLVFFLAEVVLFLVPPSFLLVVLLFSSLALVIFVVGVGSSACLSKI